MKPTVRSAQIVNATTYPGFGFWIVRHFVNDCLICETKRNTRKEARAIARKYIETGIIPMH